MLEVLDLGCAVDPGILTSIVAYEVVHQFGPKTRCFPPHIWACLYMMLVQISSLDYFMGPLY